MGAGGLYKGESDEVVLVIGGIHESEQSGVEIVCWVREILDGLEAKNRKPKKTIKVIPDIDEARGKLARSKYRERSSDQDGFKPPKKDAVVKALYREVMNDALLANTDSGIEELLKEGNRKIEEFVHVQPNRMFPAPGTPRQWLGLDPASAKKQYDEIIDYYRQQFWRDLKESARQRVAQYEDMLSLMTGGPAVSNKPLPFPTEPKFMQELAAVSNWKPVLDVMDLVESLRPVIIVSCHGMAVQGTYRRDVEDSFPGVFVDPRYEITTQQISDFIKGQLTGKKRDVFGAVMKESVTLISLDPLKFESSLRGSAFSDLGKKDDDLALKTARHIFENPANAKKKSSGINNPVAGNWLNEKTNGGKPVVHYVSDKGTPNPESERRAIKNSAVFRGTGFSLGDWGPVDVSQSGGIANVGTGTGIRKGAPVFTVEPPDYHPSGAFDPEMILLVDQDGKLTDNGKKQQWDAKGTSLPRAIELRTFAEAIVEVICETKI
jgi:hypothetical protein